MITPVSLPIALTQSHLEEHSDRNALKHIIADVALDES